MILKNQCNEKNCQINFKKAVNKQLFKVHRTVKNATNNKKSVLYINFIITITNTTASIIVIIRFFFSN